jgi:hypothetical protein
VLRENEMFTLAPPDGTVTDVFWPLFGFETLHFHALTT